MGSQTWWVNGLPVFGDVVGDGDNGMLGLLGLAGLIGLAGLMGKIVTAMTVAATATATDELNLRSQPRP